MIGQRGRKQIGTWFYFQRQQKIRLLIFCRAVDTQLITDRNDGDDLHFWWWLMLLFEDLQPWYWLQFGDMDRYKSIGCIATQTAERQYKYILILKIFSRCFSNRAVLFFLEKSSVDLGSSFKIAIPDLRVRVPRFSFLCVVRIVPLHRFYNQPRSILLYTLGCVLF